MMWVSTRVWNHSAQSCEEFCFSVLVSSSVKWMSGCIDLFFWKETPALTTFVCVCVCVHACVHVCMRACTQLCLTFCDPIDHFHFRQHRVVFRTACSLLRDMQMAVSLCQAFWGHTGVLVAKSGQHRDSNRGWVVVGGDVPETV